MNSITFDPAPRGLGKSTPEIILKCKVVTSWADDLVTGCNFPEESYEISESIIIEGFLWDEEIKYFIQIHTIKHIKINFIILNLRAYPQFPLPANIPSFKSIIRPGV